MLTTPDDSAAAADGPAAKPKADAPLPLKVDPADALLEPQLPPGPSPARARERGMRSGRTWGLLLSGFAVLALSAGAWVGGATYGTGLWSSPSRSHRDDVRRAADHEATMTRLQQISTEVATLKAFIATGSGGQPINQTGSVTSTRIEDELSSLSRKIDSLDNKVSDRMTKINDDLGSLKRQVAVDFNAPSNGAPSSTRHKRRLHDAFDPSRDPTAPGAPRPLGSH